MFPQDARLRNFTYSSVITVDFNITIYVKDSSNIVRTINNEITNIHIGKMPIMLKSSICVLTQQNMLNNMNSGECNMDCGGYFIIKGSEKTVLGQERAAENRVYCFDGKNTTKWSYYAEIKSVPDFKCISPKQFEVLIANKNNGYGNGIYCNIPRVKNSIELFTLFRAFGVISDKDICNYIVLDEKDEGTSKILHYLQSSIIDANKYLTQDEAIKHITSSVMYTPINMDKETGAKKKKEFTIEILNNDIFPHCKTLKQTEISRLENLQYRAAKIVTGAFHYTSREKLNIELGWETIQKRADILGLNVFHKIHLQETRTLIRKCQNLILKGNIF